jgi:hypothetical protein
VRVALYRSLIVLHYQQFWNNSGNKNTALFLVKAEDGIHHNHCASRLNWLTSAPGRINFQPMTNSRLSSLLLHVAIEVMETRQTISGAKEHKFTCTTAGSARSGFCYCGKVGL